MTPRFGIDTSVLVRLVTGDSELGFAYCVETLSTMIEEERGEIFASNQVIGGPTSPTRTTMAFPRSMREPDCSMFFRAG